MTSERNNLIGQLAAAMGAGDFSTTKYESSRYDQGTGTLYCNGHIISHSTIEKAKAYFELMMKKCNVSEPAGRDMYSIYELALESIKSVENRITDNCSDNEKASV